MISNQRKEKEIKKELLEWIMESVGGEYISDLKQPRFAEAVRTAVSDLDEEMFSLKEWNSAICYIIGAVQSFQNAAEAKAFLEGWDGAGEY